MSRTRATELVHCARRRRSGTVPGRRGWSLSAPILRRGRIQLGAPQGPVQVFAESDYCYGIGPLALKVHRVERAGLRR